MKRKDVVALAWVIGLLVILVPLVLRSGERDGFLRKKADQTKCANQLRQSALAGTQYASSKRFWPHVSPRRDLDGGVDSNHTPKNYRLLVWWAYQDSPEDFVCPASMDGSAPMTSKAKQNMRDWFWSSKDGASSREQGPIVHGDDPKLSETWELSYGWTRKTVLLSSRSTTPVAADRANLTQGGEKDSPLGGNHADGWNVAHVDGLVEYRKTDYGPGDTKGVEWLAGTSKPDQGYLAVRPSGYSAKGVAKPAWAKSKRPGAGCGQSCRLSTPGSFGGAGQGLALALLVLGLVVLRRREE